MGKHTMTRAYMLYLAHWARKLSWKETALSFRTTWDHVCQAVEYVVQWGLEHRELGSIRAIGVDEIAFGRGHKYLTLVYQIEADCVRLLWVGKERTTQSFEKFFTFIGQDLATKIEFVCSDMWRPYLDLIAKHCTQALNILDRFSSGHLWSRRSILFSQYPTTTTAYSTRHRDSLPRVADGNRRLL